MVGGEGVVDTRRSTGGHVLGVAVELLIPSETSWGAHSRLKKTSAELVRLHHAMQSGNIDPRILREFRDAVDYVRKTAWAAEEWQERQLQKRDPQTVLPLITAERIRRATQLSDAISDDLAAHEVSSETTGMAELFRSLGRLHQNLSDLFKDHES